LLQGHKLPRLTLNVMPRRCVTCDLVSSLPHNVFQKPVNKEHYYLLQLVTSFLIGIIDIVCALYTMFINCFYLLQIGEITDFMKKTVERHQTLREKILEVIKDAIISGEMKAGSRVSEPEMAERFGISRTPIREAFRQLAAEGYLTIVPRKGAVIRIFSPRDIEEFYAVKSILEGYAARLACEKLSDKDIDRLEAINNRLEDLGRQNDVKHFFKIHNDFHSLFIKAADNEKLREIHNSLVERFQRLRFTSLSLPGRMALSVQEHKKIIEAFRARDGEKAEQLVRKNAEYGGRVLMEGHGAQVTMAAC